MPELPEVETVRRTLAAAVIGRRVRSVDLRRPDYAHRGDGAGPMAPTAKDLLAGAVIERLARHGKQLAIVGADGRSICVHLGMSGQVLLADRRRLETLNHAHVIWKLDGDQPEYVVMRDPRRFGGVWTYRDFDSLRRCRWETLGPDALVARATALRAALAKSARPVKAALLDQSVIAGVGNIYCDEALHQARINPLAPANTLSSSQVQSLAAAIRATLRRSIKSGGTTLRDYRDANGKAGSFQRLRSVYGRAGEACLTCGETLARGVVAQRTTVWCARCQA